MVEEYIGHRAEQQPELVGPPFVTAGAVGVKIELLLFDPVFHIAARAVAFVVEFLWAAAS